MATCKECFHIDICDSLRPIEYCLDKTCSQFKPTKDVVKVVRCKDCKHWIYWADQKRCSCIKHHIQSNSYDFCSYGEVKELGK